MNSSRFDFVGTSGSTLSGQSTSEIDTSSSGTSGGFKQIGISNTELDVSVSGTNASFVIQAIDISQDPNNSDTGSANANILVRINKHFYRSGTGI